MTSTISSVKRAVNKSELVASVSEVANLSKAESDRAIDAVLSVISQELKQGGEVKLLGFGTFSVLLRAELEGRNPRTGEKMKIPARRVPRFRPGAQLKSLLES